MTFRGPSAAWSHNKTEDLWTDPGSTRTSTRLPRTSENFAALIHHVTARPVLHVDLTPSGEYFPVVAQVFAPGLQAAKSVPAPEGGRDRLSIRRPLGVGTTSA